MYVAVFQPRIFVSLMAISIEDQTVSSTTKVLLHLFKGRTAWSYKARCGYINSLRYNFFYVYVVKYLTRRKYSSKVHLFPKFSKSITSSLQCRRFVFSSRSKSCTFCILTPFVVSRVSSFVLSDRTVTSEIAHELDHSKYVGKLSQLRWRIRDISETSLHNTVRPNEVCLSTVHSILLSLLILQEF